MRSGSKRRLVTSATRTSIKMADGLGLDSWWGEPGEVAFVSASCCIATDNILTAGDHLVEREAQVREDLNVHVHESSRSLVTSHRLR